MKKHIITFLLGLIFFSCNSGNIDKPKNLIDKKEMSNLVADLFLHQSLLQNENASQDIESYAKNAMGVLAHYNVTYEQFSASYKYYGSDPAVLEKILVKSQDILKSQLSEESKKKAEEIEKEAQKLIEAESKNDAKSEN